MKQIKSKMLQLIKSDGDLEQIEEKKKKKERRNLKDG